MAVSKKVIFLATTISLFLGACDSGSTQTGQQSNASGQQTSAIPSDEDRCKELVRNNLKDPDSANFKDVRAAYYDGKLQMCKGLVNAKNSMGGYVGFKEFEMFSDQSIYFKRD